MKRRSFLRHGAILAAAGAATLLYGARRAAAASILFDQTMPDPDGREHRLDGWLGKPVVANFWATWCAPCVEEMPDLEALHHKYTTTNFIGIGIDTAPNIRAFTEKVKVSYPILVGGRDGIQLMRDLGNKAGGLPFTVVFDAKGHSVDSTLGRVKPARLEQILAGLQG